MIPGKAHRTAAAALPESHGLARDEGLADIRDRFFSRLLPFV